MIEVRASKLSEKEVRECIAKCNNVPVEQVVKHGFTYYIEKEVLNKDKEKADE